MSNRNLGEKKNAQDLETEPYKHLLHMTKTLIRTDWGGQTPSVVVQRKMKEAGFVVALDEAEAIVGICVGQVASSRERTKPRFIELSRRLSKLDSIQTAFNSLKKALN